MLLIQDSKTSITWQQYLMIIRFKKKLINLFSLLLLVTICLRRLQSICICYWSNLLHQDHVFWQSLIYKSSIKILNVNVTVNDFFFYFSYWNERISNMNHQMNWSIIWSRLDHYLDSHNHHHFLNHHHYHHHHYPFFMTLKAFLINISSLIMIAKRIELQQHQQKMEHNKHIL